MKIALESTPEFGEVNGVRVRVWTGKTDAGVKINAFIAAIQVLADADCEEFERELHEMKNVKAVELPEQPADEWTDAELQRAAHPANGNVGARSLALALIAARARIDELSMRAPAAVRALGAERHVSAALRDDLKQAMKDAVTARKAWTHSGKLRLDILERIEGYEREIDRG